MQGKGFVSGGREAMRDAGVPAIDLPYESAYYDRWFDFINRENYQRYGIVSLGCCLSTRVNASLAYERRGELGCVPSCAWWIRRRRQERAVWRNLPMAAGAWGRSDAAAHVRAYAAKPPGA